MVKKSSGIANQLVRWFLLIAILPLAIVMYLVFRNSVNSLQQNMTQNLLAVATRQSDQIRTYIRERERNVTTLSRMSDIVKAMDNYRCKI
jgi:nitrogen fixation/metabolism regulation signal transduction histidine kinase